MGLLGVLTETEHNAPTRAYLARRGEGIERIATAAEQAVETAGVRSGTAVIVPPAAANGYYSPSLTAEHGTASISTC